MLKKLNACQRIVSVAVVLLSCKPLIINAQTYNVSENYGTISLGQGNGSVDGGQSVQNASCVPTAVANGLSYLEAYQLSLGSDPFSVAQDAYATVNTLQTAMGTTANGTSYSGALNGLQSYLPTVSSLGLTVSGQYSSGLGSSYFGGGLNLGINGQSANPTLQYLDSALSANSAAQIGILWGTVSSGTFTPAGGGNFVSLTAMKTTNGSGGLTILDPWGSGNPNAGTSATSLNATVQTVSVTGYGSVLEVSYAAADAAGESGETAFGGGGPPTGATGLIVADAVEAVPEPSTWVLIGMGAVAVLALQRRQILPQLARSVVREN